MSDVPSREEFRKCGYTEAAANYPIFEPRFTRAQLIDFTEPRIDTGKFNNWARRGFLDPATKWTKSNVHKRYGGGHAIALMILQVLSQTGLPFRLADQIVEIALRFTIGKLSGQAGGALLVITAGDNIEVTGAKEFERPDAAWFTVIDLGTIVTRFMTKQEQLL